MKIVLLVVLGLILGALGGAALGIGAGIAWSELIETASPGDNSGVLAFFTLMPIGAGIGAMSGAVLFGVIAVRDGEIQIEQRSAGPDG